MNRSDARKKRTPPDCVVDWRLAETEAEAEDFFQLVHQHYRRFLLRYVRRLTWTYGDIAEDIVQEVFLKLVKKRREIHLTNFEGFLRKLAYNQVYDDVLDSKFNREVSFAEIDQKLGDPDPSDVDLDESILLQELLEHPVLSQVEREALLLRIEGLTYDEIADVLKIRAGAARERAYAARQKLTKSVRGKK